jgi:outer membrane protein TolC
MNTTMKYNNIKKILLLILVFAYNLKPVFAQQVETYNMQQLFDSALANNHILKIKSLQINEKNAKIKEDGVKKYPSVILNSTYQYNVNLSQLVVSKGSFGSLPIGGTTINLPNTDVATTVIEHNTFNIGPTIYQPITQLGKINIGLEIDRNDVQLAKKEKEKIESQITQNVERLYYAILIAKKQTVETNAKLELAKMKLYDVESALLSGKTININKSGLQANIANEEQNILKLTIELEDYWADLKNLIGLKNEKAVDLKEPEINVAPINAFEYYKTIADKANVDIQIASINKSKANLALKATKQNSLPDLGVIAGYSYQIGNILYPTNIPFVGLNFKWDLQTLFSNKHIQNQRSFVLKQTEENLQNTQEQVNKDIQKSFRKINQAKALIDVAQKATNYRREALKEQTDKQAAGLNVTADILETKSALAKSEADLYAAQLSYRLAISDLNILTGK